MKPRSAVLLLAMVAFSAKIYCAATTIGTSDVVFFSQFGATIHERGLLSMYKATPLFNHTPLIGWFSEAVYRLSGGGKPQFAFLLRLPAIFADLFGVLALLWFREKTGRPAWWALALYAVSPVGFMISGYHGNVDSVVALAVVLAAISCAVDRPVLCGLCLGLACNIKIAPLILVPAFFFASWHRRQAWRFALPTVLIVLAGWSYPLFYVPGLFLKNVLSYGSVWGVWGITYALRLTNLQDLRDIGFGDPTPAQSAITFGLKSLVIAPALFLAWRRRKSASLEIFETLALTWAVFLVFAPGFAPQYLAWIMPCFLLASEAWFAWVLATSSVALFVFYNAISHGMPWHHGFTVHSTASHWAWAFVIPWLTLAAFLGRHLPAYLCWRRQDESASLDFASGRGPSPGDPLGAIR